MIYFNEKIGLYWPKYDSKPERVFNALMKNKNSVEEVVSYCKSKTCCVQAGGHVGVWPNELKKYFNRVITFEPDPACYHALVKNVDGKVEHHNKALGTKTGVLYIEIKESSSVSQISKKGIPISSIAIDELNLEFCDLIYLDIEGYEVSALKGAINTIKKFRPVICVEELKNYREPLRSHLNKIGYKNIAKTHRDSIWV